MLMKKWLHDGDSDESWHIYLLVFLGAVSEKDAFLHVAIQNLLYGRHVTFYDIFHLCG